MVPLLFSRFNEYLSFLFNFVPALHASLHENDLRDDDDSSKRLPNLLFRFLPSFSLLPKRERARTDSGDYPLNGGGKDNATGGETAARPAVRRAIEVKSPRSRVEGERRRTARVGKVTVRQSGCGAGFAAALLSTWVDRCHGGL